MHSICSQRSFIVEMEFFSLLFGQRSPLKAHSSSERGWLSSLNPFGRRPSDSQEDCDDRSSTSTQRSLSLRPISMRDFQLAVNKAKEAKAHCSNPLTRQRLELD